METLVTILILVGLGLAVGWFIFVYRWIEKFPRINRVWKKVTYVFYVAFFLVVAGSVGLVAIQFFWPGYWVEVNDPLWHLERGKIVLDVFTLKNKTTSNLKDFQIGCEVLGNSGTVIVTLTGTLFDTLKKHEQKAFSNVLLDGTYPDQGVATNCRVLDAKHIW